MDIKELKELITLYETIKDTNLSIQELVHYIETLKNEDSIKY